jgi:hypothetical protein
MIQNSDAKWTYHSLKQTFLGAGDAAVRRRTVKEE